MSMNTVESTTFPGVIRNFTTLFPSVRMWSLTHFFLLLSLCLYSMYYVALPILNPVESTMRKFVLGVTRRSSRFSRRWITE